MESGDVYLAEVGQERRIRVVVLTNGEDNRRAGRVVVAPRFDAPADPVPSPWRVGTGDEVYAIDLHGEPGDVEAARARRPGLGSDLATH